MQISLHIGVHGTDEDRLLKGLLRNANDFRKDGVAIPGPSRYRALLSDALNGWATARRRRRRARCCSTPS